MNHSFIQFHNITFQYESASTVLFHDISFHLAPGWTGIVGANGIGKTTLLKLASGVLEADEGNIMIPQRAMYCPQRTDDMPPQFEKFLNERSKAAEILKGMLGIQDEWGDRWDTLSHGERKRSQIVVALWQEPDILAVDEPTNHVDAEARSIIAGALHTFQGVGLLVSHDRELLDSLCQQCLFIEPPDVILRPGGVTQGMEQAAREQHAAQKEYTQKKQAYKKLKREAAKRREKAQQADKKRSKRKIGRKDHDAKEKIDRARITGKDAVAGKLLRQLSGRMKQAQQQAESIQVKKDYTLGIWLPGSRSHRKTLLELSAGTLVLGDDKQLVFPDLFIKPEDRIAITGPNGAGKSSLIRHFLGRFHVPKEQMTYVPQEIDRYQSRQILSKIQSLPNEQLGHLMTILSRLGSRPHRLLDSEQPSPGEIRKLLLALGMTRQPHVIIMDEPTNHLDLPSIECLETALAECPCCLVLVSHDERFLQPLAQTRWNLMQKDEPAETFELTPQPFVPRTFLAD